MIEDDLDEYAPLESGPFCPHWRAPWECDELCTCGHACREHQCDSCDVCDCEAFREPEAT